MDPRLIEADRLLKQGQPQLAEVLCRQVLSASPGDAQALAMLGAMYQARADWAGSLAHFDKALASQPHSPVLLNLRGLSLKSLGRFEEALASYDAALAAKPGFLQAMNNRAVALRHLGREQECLAAFGEAIALKPDSPDLHNNFGLALLGFGRLAEALAAWDRALALRPDWPEGLHNRAMVLHDMGRLREAEAAYRQVLQINPRSSETLMNLGVTLYRQFKFQEGLDMLDRALALRPGGMDIQINRANVLVELDRFDEALALYAEARAANPRDVQVLMNIGNALRDQHRFSEALAAYDEALALKPGDASVHWNRSLCLLTSGDLERGWAEYEWRWKGAKQGNVQRQLDAPVWLGEESIDGKTVLVHTEQGLGDSIQMARYARVLSGMGARVILQVQKALLPVMHEVAGAARVIGPDEVPGPIDFHCPMFSLPLATHTTRETVPSPLGIFHADAALAARWREKLPRDGMPHIGLVWSGNPNYASDHRRSLGLAQFRAALPEGAHYWCLKKDVLPTEVPMLEHEPPIGRFDDNDFIHTAAQISALDLVISVDTSVMHLAATLGTPTWIVLSFTADFRWCTDTAATPWYPGARIFRQRKPGEWAPVLQDIRAAIEGLAGKAG